MKIEITQQKLMKYLFAFLVLVFAVISSINISYYGMEQNPWALVCIATNSLIGMYLVFKITMFLGGIMDGDITLFKPIVIDTEAKRKALEEHKREVIDAINREDYEAADEAIKRFKNK
jgi:hypothetical protein